MTSIITPISLKWKKALCSMKLIFVIVSLVGQDRYWAKSFSFPLQMDNYTPRRNIYELGLRFKENLKIRF